MDDATTTSQKAVNVQLPNGAIMSSNRTTLLNIPQATSKGNTAHVFKDLATGNLLSVGQLCDDGYKIHFTKTNVILSKNGKIAAQGNRNSLNGMWYINLPIPTTKSNIANFVLPYKPIKKAIQFLHAACFSPCISTWCNAIDNGFFKSWPILTSKRVRQCLEMPPSATIKGHMTQERQNLRSTSKMNFAINEKQIEKPSHDCFIKIETIDKSELSYSDQTGRFPLRSTRNHQYIFVLFDTASNHIFAEPIKNRTSKEISKAYSKIYYTLRKAGISSKLHILDNESSKDFTELLKQNHGKIQFVPPNAHRRNVAERAIRTFKAHFIAGLSSAHPSFPLNLWDRLIPQAQMTLNMMRKSNINEKLSAYEQVFGTYDYNSTPIAPPGTQSLLHLKNNQRGTWAPKAINAWYIGPCMSHYRCLNFYVPSTAGERVSDTAQLYPTMVETPTWTQIDEIIDAATALTAALQPTFKSNLTSTLKLAQYRALRQLADIFSTSFVPSQNTNNEYQAPRVEIKSNIPNQNRYVPETFPKNQDLPPQHAHPPLANHSNTKKTLHMGNFLKTIYLHEKYGLPKSYCNAIIDPVSGKSMEYRHLIKNKHTRKIWNNSFANELGRLANGVGNRIKGTNTIKFIPRNKVPLGRKVTYGKIVVDFRPLKTEPNRTRLTVGGDKVDYPGIVRTDTADIVTAKLLLNSIVSTSRARCCILDIKDFYLNNKLPRYEFMRMPIALIPQEIIQEYHLQNIVSNDGYIYMQIEKGMYGLPQAGKIANQELETHLAPFGYHPCPRTPGLWRHKTRPISFALVVDDFAIKYVGQEHKNHLLKALESKYKVTIDDQATQFCGISLTWDYRKRQVTLAMPDYIPKLLHKLQYKPKTPEHNPHTYKPPSYGKTIQYVEQPDTSPLLPPQRKKRIQQIVGSLLYYARAVDNTILMAVNDLGSQQANATESTERQAHKLLNYLATHPNAAITFKPSDMVLRIHSDASYLSAPNSRSRAGGYFYMSIPDHLQDAPTFLNAPVHVECKIMKNVLASATEAEIGALFLNCQQAEMLRTTLAELGHPQQKTTIITDNLTANNIINGTAKQRRTKAMDMRYNWIVDRQTRQHFLVSWQPGKENWADYFTKHHSTVHHKRLRSTYLT